MSTPLSSRAATCRRNAALLALFKALSAPTSLKSIDTDEAPVPVEVHSAQHRAVVIRYEAATVNRPPIATHLHHWRHSAGESLEPSLLSDFAATRRYPPMSVCVRPVATVTECLLLALCGHTPIWRARQSAAAYKRPNSLIHDARRAPNESTAAL